MNIPVSSLMPGDVLIIKYNDHYWHTMMVVSANRLAHTPGEGQPCTIELVNAFAEKTKVSLSWNDQQLLKNLHAYRYSGEKPNPDWVELAEQWSVPDSNGKITRYASMPTADQKKLAEWHNYPRYRGVLKGDDNHNAAALPFGVDALWRTVKWAKRYRYNEAFSVERGTTCCAFVMACIQASFVNAAFTAGSDGKANLAKVIDTFNTQVRGERTHVKGQPHAGGALRENSNRGLSDGLKAKQQTNQLTESQVVRGLWKDLHKNNLVNCGWTDLGIPAGLQYDAKYVYSRTFNYMLTNDNAWTAK